LESIKKFKTIGQIALDLKLPQHVLRFWESRFKQLKPLKLSGNRRYYREIDVELIGYIKNLLHEDCVSIKGVQKIFGNQSINQILKSKNPILKKKNVLSDDKNFKKENLGNSNKEHKEILKEILNDLKKIKNSI
jgi:DNA-binding transcriptional MerR regulator|tara:strand:+ start:226 stop:627 length:402 start_codon:yes stop_codon:yes gene_type:complete